VAVPTAPQIIAATINLPLDTLTFDALMRFKAMVGAPFCAHEEKCQIAASTQFARLHGRIVQLRDAKTSSDVQRVGASGTI
jgi:hypothetical protein